MISKSDQEFLSTLNQRAKENAELTSGGVPAPLQPFASWIGLHTPQTIALGGLLITTLWLTAAPTSFMSFTRTILIMK